MEQVLIGTDSEVLQGMKLPQLEIYIKSKRVNKGVLVSTTIIENGQIKRYGKKRGY